MKNMIYVLNNNGTVSFNNQSYPIDSLIEEIKLLSLSSFKKQVLKDEDNYIVNYTFQTLKKSELFKLGVEKIIVTIPKIYMGIYSNYIKILESYLGESDILSQEGKIQSFSKSIFKSGYSGIKVVGWLTEKKTKNLKIDLKLKENKNSIVDSIVFDDESFVFDNSWAVNSPQKVMKINMR